MFTSVAHCPTCSCQRNLPKSEKSLKKWKGTVPVLPNSYGLSTVSQCTLTWPRFQAPAFVIYCTYVSVSMQGKKHAKIRSVGKPPPD